jgi:hypothetical protein
MEPAAPTPTKRDKFADGRSDPCSLDIAISKIAD